MGYPKEHYKIKYADVTIPGNNLLRKVAFKVTRRKNMKNYKVVSILGIVLSVISLLALLANPIGMIEMGILPLILCILFMKTQKVYWGVAYVVLFIISRITILLTGTLLARVVVLAFAAWWIVVLIQNKNDKDKKIC